MEYSRSVLGTVLLLLVSFNILALTAAAFAFYDRAWVGKGIIWKAATISYVATLASTLYMQLVPAWEYSIGLILLYLFYSTNAIVNAVLCIPRLGGNPDLDLTRINILVFDMGIVWALTKGPLSKWAFALPWRAYENIVPTLRRAFDAPSTDTMIVVDSNTS